MKIFDTVKKNGKAIGGLVLGLGIAGMSLIGVFKHKPKVEDYEDYDDEQEQDETVEEESEETPDDGEHEE